MKLAPCPDCGNACSLTATTCPRCGRIMKLGDLSESNLIKPPDYSKLLNFLVNALALITGVIMFLLIIFIGLMNNIYDDEKMWSFLLIQGLILFITFSVLGTFFSVVCNKWNKSGWKLGLSLGIVPVILLSIAILIDSLQNDNNDSSTAIKLILIAIPGLAGGCIGAYFGTKYKQKHHTNNSVV
jgi:vacuolar-type H+-ATPase subunit I/STV1